MGSINGCPKLRKYIKYFFIPLLQIIYLSYFFSTSREKSDI